MPGRTEGQREETVEGTQVTQTRVDSVLPVTETQSRPVTAAGVSLSLGSCPHPVGPVPTRDSNRSGTGSSGTHSPAETYRSLLVHNPLPESPWYKPPRPESTVSRLCLHRGRTTTLPCDVTVELPVTPLTPSVLRPPPPRYPVPGTPVGPDIWAPVGDPSTPLRNLLKNPPSSQREGEGRQEDLRRGKRPLLLHSLGLRNSGDDRDVTFLSRRSKVRLSFKLRRRRACLGMTR